MGRTSYLVALGSNRRGRHGGPRAELRAAVAALDAMEGARVTAVAPVIETAPIGPSIRRYANGAAIVETTESPDALLRRLKAIERGFGRRRGRRWGARVLDLDIILWSGGTWGNRVLTVPHPAFRERDFVLVPACAIAAHWRDPVSGHSVRCLHARLRRRLRRAGTPEQAGKRIQVTLPG